LTRDHSPEPSESRAAHWRQTRQTPSLVAGRVPAARYQKETLRRGTLPTVSVTALAAGSAFAPSPVFSVYQTDVLTWRQPPRRAHEFTRLCCVDGSHRGGEGAAMMRIRRSRPVVTMPPGFAGFRFPPEVILLAVRWYLRYGLSTATSRSSWPNVASRSTT